MGVKESKETENLPSTITGLYTTCRWEPKSIKRFILNKKLAPIYQGKDASEESDELEECPICFLLYPSGLNRFGCCKKGICTECFLQISNPNSTSGINCPFCNRTNCYVTYLGPRSAEEKAKEAEEKQKVIELQIKIRNEEVERERQRSLSGAPPDPSLFFPKSAPSFSFQYPPPHFTTSSSVSPQRSSMPFPPPHTHLRSNHTNNQRRQAIPTSPNSFSSLRRRAIPAPNRHNVDDQWGDMTPEDIEEMLIRQAIEMSLSEMPSENEQNEEDEEYPLPSSKRRGSESTISTTKTRSESSRSSISNDESVEDLDIARAISLSLQQHEEEQD